LAPPRKPEEGVQVRVRLPPLRAVVKVSLPTDVVVPERVADDPLTAKRTSLPLAGSLWIVDSYWSAHRRRVTVFSPPHSAMVRLLRLTFAASVEESWLGECAHNHDFGP
jgi:hypothetical protein